MIIRYNRGEVPGTWYFFGSCHRTPGLMGNTFINCLLQVKGHHAVGGGGPCVEHSHAHDLRCRAGNSPSDSSWPRPKAVYLPACPSKHANHKQELDEGYLGHSQLCSQRGSHRAVQNLPSVVERAQSPTASLWEPSGESASSKAIRCPHPMTNHPRA